jgi:hypothetical protein
MRYPAPRKVPSMYESVVSPNRSEFYMGGEVAATPRPGMAQCDTVRPQGKAL